MRPPHRAMFLVITASLIMDAVYAEKTEYRVLPQLETTSDTIHPIPLGFSSRTLLPPMTKGEVPSIMVSNHGKYIAKRNVLYTAVSKDGRNKFWSLPSDYPVYDEGVQFDGLKGSRYIPVFREDGLYDLIRPSDWQYLKQTGTPEQSVFENSYKVYFEGKIPKGKEWIADVDGDEIPDILIGSADPAESKFQMYPEWDTYGHPWSGIEQPNLGMLPDSDIQNFRGYDIAGNWLGDPIKRHLWWAKGNMENGRLAFGPFSKVRYGETDYELQWRSYGFNLHPVVMELEGRPHIILFSDNDKVMSVPVRGVKDGYLHVGKAIPLLEGGETLKSTIHANVIGVGDLNLDGQQDLVIGSGGNGRLTVLSGDKAGSFKELGNIFHEGGPITADTLALPIRIDWNQDGLPDIIIGDGSGIISLRYGTDDPLLYDDYLNFETPSGYIRHRPLDGNLQGDNETAWSYVQPEVFDWDGDGNLDIITNDNEAKLFFYKGRGHSTMLEERQRLMLGDKPLPVAWRTRPAVLSGNYGIAGDDRDTLLMHNWNSDIVIAVPDAPGSINFERLIDVKDVTGETINLSGPGGLSGRIKLSACDWDNDGDWDILLSSQKSLQKYFRLNGDESPTSSAFWMENIGENSDPVFQLPRMITFADGTPIAVNKHNFNAYPTDLNGDGQLDIIFGDDEGFFFYLFRDQLAWNEDVSDELALREALKTAKENVGHYSSGEIIAEEDWNALSRTDQFWASNWVTTQKGLLKQQNGMAQLSSRPPQLSEMKRYLAIPIDFDPDSTTVLNYTVSFTRRDNRNTGSGEFMEILSLKSSSNGQVLASVGFNSSEQLEVKSGEVKRTAPGVSYKVNEKYTINVRITLKPAGLQDEVFATIGEANTLIAKPSETVSLKTEINGVADILEIEIGKHGGRLQLEPFSLSVQ